MKENHKLNDYVFPNTLGKMMSETTLKRRVNYVIQNINDNFKKRILDSNQNIDDYEPISFTLHQTRHTFPCILRKAGVDVKQAQKWMRHKDIRILLNIYSHLDSQDDEVSVNKVNQFLS